MKAISKRQHQALIAALQQLDELQQRDELPFPIGDVLADGFLQHIQSLSERFSHYEALLSQLAEAITEYEAMYKEVRVNVVAPALRHARKQLDSKSTKATQLRVHLAVAQGF